MGIGSMEPGAWLVLATLLSNGQSYSIAWPAPDIVVCEQARTLIAQPTHDKADCTFEKPVAHAYGPPLSPAGS